MFSLLLLVMGVGQVSAQRDPDLGPDAALAGGGCLLEPFAELPVEDDADDAPVE